MRFCGGCGRALLPFTTPREERKLVTVLFADVVGSTRLAGTVDPEQVRAQMARFFDAAREEIVRYGGTVEKFIGDAVMAVFGLPVIHEDDPERAVRAASSLRARVRAQVERGSLPEIRIGIDTGEVVADVEATARGDFLVTGEVVNLAARLQQSAEPGQILIGERTMLALHGAASVRPLPPLTMKGAAAALPVWAVLDAPPAQDPMPATPFVGRSGELEALDTWAQRACHERRGQVITVLAEAGTGKSRLAQEFRARHATMRCLLGRTVAYGTGVPFSAIGEAVKEECGILMGDSLEAARAKLSNAIARLAAGDAVPALLTVLSLNGEGREVTREVLFSGLRAFFEALARRTPLLLIFEDVHAAEDATLDFVEHAADWVSEMPIVLLALARPDLLERRPAWMRGRRATTALSLDPLPGEQSRALIRRVLGSAVPAPLMDVVLERAEGNPLFIEEMLRTIMEQQVLTAGVDGGWALAVPASDIAIPDTIHAVIAARVDALPGPEKRLLQVAAVVGRDFWLGATRFITEDGGLDAAMPGLVTKGLVAPKRQSTLVGEQEYAFRHALIRDVAYAMLPKASRWPAHVRCAEWHRRVAGDRAAEYADCIAHHWLEVLTLRRDLGLPPDAVAREQAIANLQVAGDRAAGLYANSTAVAHFTRVLELNPEPAFRIQALLGRGRVQVLLGRYAPARDDFVAARDLARQTGARRREAIALDALGYSYRQQDEIARALACLEQALALSRQMDDPSLTGRILNHIGFAYFNTSKHAEAIRSHEEARQLLDRCGDLGGLAESLHGLGDNLMFLGRFRESVDRCTESARVSERIGNRSLAGENRYMIAGAREILGQYAQAQSEAKESIAVLADIGDVWNLSFGLHVAARIATSTGEPGEAIEYASRGLTLARQINAPRQAAVNLHTIGDVLRELEDTEGAWRAHREAVDLARVGEVGAFWMPRLLSSLALDALALGRMEEAQRYIEEAQRSLGDGPRRLDYPQQVTHAEGRMLHATGRPAEARSAAERLIAMTAATGALHWRVPALLLLADAAGALGDPAAAASTYRSASDEAERLGRTPLLWRALAGLADTSRVMGHPGASRTSASRAGAVVDRLAATVPEERLRTIFLRSPAVERVRALGGGVS